MKWRTDKPEEGVMVIAYMPAYTRRASGSGQRFPVKERVGLAEWWDDHDGRPDGMWFHRKSGNVIIDRPVSHWMPLPFPDEEMAEASATIVQDAKQAQKDRRDAAKARAEDAAQPQQ